MQKQFDIDAAVKTLHIGACEISMQKIRGAQNNVFISKSKIDGSEYVYKFNSAEMVLKNELVAQMLDARNIPVPRVVAHSAGHQWFEVYPKIPGRTLYECIGDGMTPDDIDGVYADILDLFAQMSKIDWRPIYKMKYSQTYDVAKANVTDVNNKFMGKLYSGAVKLMNRGDNDARGLYHCGITPKNVIIGHDGHIAALVDMDEVAIANKNYAFGMMAAKYQQLRGNINTLIDSYEFVSGQILDKNRIHTISNITNFGKRLMWLMGRRKQIHQR